MTITSVRIIVCSLVSIAVIARVVSATIDDCDWVNEVTGTVPRAVEMERQACIMEALEEKAKDAFSDHLEGMSDLKDLNSQLRRSNPSWTALQMPPSYLQNSDTVVTLWDAEIRTIDPQINDGKVAFEGYFHLSWEDPRLRWDSSKYKVDHVLLNEKRMISRMWVPEFSVNDTTGKGAFQTSELIIPKLNSNGKINASVFLHWTVNCELLIQNYPKDEGQCQVRFLDDWHKEPGKVILKVTNENIRESFVFTSPKAWMMEKGTITAMKDPVDSITKLTVTVDLIRENSFGSALVFVPIILATILAAMAPLFGTFKWQSFVKVISLVLMYLALGNFTTTATELMYGTGMPKILGYYQFTMIVTIVSLMVSLFIWAMSRRSTNVPPPHSITMITDRFAKCFLCGSSEDTLEPKEAADANKDQWSRLYGALSCVFFVIFLIVYILGTIIFCT